MANYDMNTASLTGIALEWQVEGKHWGNTSASSPIEIVKMERLPKHPSAGSITGEYLESADGFVKVPAMMSIPEALLEVKRCLATYQWNDSDFLLASYPKNGAHFLWEVMTMLLNGSADYIQDPKEAMFIDMFPVSQFDKIIPSPRVLNTHYRTDVLSPEFRKGKTVIMMRNPKDVCVSFYHHEVKVKPTSNPLYRDFGNLPFGQMVKMFLFDKDVPFGSYFDYTEYMWTLRDDPNHLLVFYEDLKLKPVTTIFELNEFMGSNASPELVQQIADATSFDKMKRGKMEREMSEGFKEFLGNQKGNGMNTEKMKKVSAKLFRKGGIGDWKNHFTVADNEMFNEFLASWEGGKDIPFKYTQS